MEKEKVKIVNNTLSGGLWFGGWLFTIGFLHLAIPKAIYAIVLWPYYLGAMLGSVWNVVTPAL
jgi:hypothetical protein